MPSLMKRPNSCPGSSCPGCSSANCYAEGGNVESGKSRHDYEWGINKPFGGAGHSSGTSDQGLDVRAKEYGAAKSDAKNILHQMKWQKGQDRKNLAHGGEVEDDDEGVRGSLDKNYYTKGVHSSFAGRGNSKMGSAAKGHWSHGDPKRNNEVGQREHSKVMGEMSEMKKGDRTNLAEGGEVSDHDEMHEALGHELMEAFDKKDKKGVMSAIEACVMRCMSKE